MPPSYSLIYCVRIDFPLSCKSILFFIQPLITFSFLQLSYSMFIFCITVPTSFKFLHFYFSGICLPSKFLISSVIVLVYPMTYYLLFYFDHFLHFFPVWPLYAHSLFYHYFNFDFHLIPLRLIIYYSWYIHI